MLHRKGVCIARSYAVPLWPEAPPGAILNRPIGDLGPYWQVFGLPPMPWPKTPAYGWDTATFGPKGTVWGPFSGDQVLDRQQALSNNNVLERVAKWLRKFGVRTVDGSGSWTVPYSTYHREDRTMRMIRATIHGKIGTTEEVAHVMHWAPSAGPDTDLDIPALLTFGQALRDAWGLFMNTAATGAIAAKTFIGSELVYDEVRIAFLEFTAGNPKPVYRVPTQYVAFSGTTVKGASGSLTLPYEVSCCLSLGTNFRGARNRGRLYLGPIGSGLMYGDGKFDVASVQGIAKNFALQVVAPLNANSVADLHVLSTKYQTSVPVQAVRVGVVPDSQRRRRQSQVEASTLVWGTPVGSAT